jgi:hypothetical protein
MRWIKESERLPDRPGKYWIKYNNRRGEIKTGSLFDGFKFPHHKSRIEWLDESPDSKGNTSAEEERIKELEKAIWQISLGPAGDDTEWIPYVIQKCKDILTKKQV